MNSSVSVKRVEDLTTEWLSIALSIKDLDSFTTERIGTGQLSECFRVHLHYSSSSSNQPKSVVLKVTAQEETSRQSGVTLGIYKHEVEFYTFVAESLKSAAIAKCYHASFDGESFCLLLHDSYPAIPGNDLVGATFEQAKLAVAELARIHASSYGNKKWEKLYKKEKPIITQPQMSYLFGAFIERYRDRIKPEHRKVCEQLVGGLDAYTESLSTTGEAHGLVHGDYRLDNMLFGGSNGAQDFTIVDWQTIAWGSTLGDLSYFLGCTLTVEERRAHSDELIKIYHSSLGSNPLFTLEQCHDGVRRQTFFGVIMAIVSAVLVTQTERGDEMFMTFLDRHCTQALDLDAVATLPIPKVMTPLQPNAKDEGLHTPGPEPLFNESWYFDVADIKNGVGAYIRLGLIPNEGKAWYTALICGPGRPTIAVLDFEAPLPDENLVVKTNAINATQTASTPLESYHVTLKGKGEVYDDPASILRGESGKPTDVDMDLSWTTAGMPYQYRITTRYEIPCIVTGTITANGETFTLKSAPGQRDHSWGVRDWWSMDWVWQTVHLDDGTHIHGLDLRVPTMPKMFIGYIQGPDLPITELAVADATEVLGHDGLVGKTELKYVYEGKKGKEELILKTESQGHGPLRLVSSDSKVAMFPRWWAKVEVGDGRKGVAWMELNHNS
jgi:hypothetical protein